MGTLTIGVLALQGCVQPHRFHIESLGAKFKTIKIAKDLENIDGLILPGGESTTMLKLMSEFDFEPPLKRTLASVPVWGICAGAILLATHVESPHQKSFGLIDITIRRNAYGRQQKSFQTTFCDQLIAFIRAPIITEIGNEVEVLTKLNGHPVWVKTNKCMVTTFHPELTQEMPSVFHHAFLEMIVSERHLLNSQAIPKIGE